MLVTSSSCVLEMYSLIFAICVFSSRQHEGGVAKEGDACNRNDTQWYVVANSDSSFLYCHPKHGLFVSEQCGLSSDGSRMMFNAEKQQCLARRTVARAPVWPLKRPSVWSSFASEARKRLGGSCSSNSHCPLNSFCDHFGVCVCIPDYTEIDRSCWKSIHESEPTEACTFSEQCDAAWPQSTCINGICECPNRTRVVKSIVGRLCLSPAYICIQPASSQNGVFHFNQYYFNSLTNECEPVMLKKGGVANANIFKTRKICEEFCKAGCLRGEPETRAGVTVECSSDADCNHPYSCHRRTTRSLAGICCPSRAFVCSPFGGMFMDVSNIEEPLVEYDEGLQAEAVQSVNFPVIRYYFTLSELKCKAFLFRGVGGNFNNFLSYEQCFDYCMPVVCNKEKAALDLNDRLIRCSQREECPKSHSCIGSICCQSEDIARLSTFCPEGSLRVDSNGDPMLCNMTSLCPLPAFCQLIDPVSKSGVCCDEKISVSFRQREPFARCPKNLTALVTADKGEPLKCSLGGDAACPISFFCSLTDVNATNGICCSFPKEELTCPAFMKPKYSKGGLEKCSPHENSLNCQLGEDVCYFNRNYGICYCCEKVLPSCPEEAQPFDKSISESVARCGAHSNASCVSPAFCFYDPMANHSICCQNKQECPDGSPSLHDENGVRLTCDGKCPIGYQCLSVGLTRDQKACCADNPLIWKCDQGRSLLQGNGEPMTCSSKIPCPKGYTCTERGLSMICCPTAEYVCGQSVSPGEHCSGSKPARAFYFDPVGKSCNGFTYAGCGGNDNHFKSVGSCEATCELSAVCSHGMPLKEDDLTRNCSAGLPCPAGYSCVTIVEGERFCCPNAELVCKLPVDPGFSCSGSPPVEDFFYDPTAVTCRQFVYEGCGGNLNRFHTIESCLSFCQTLSCPHGRPLAISGQVKRCTSSSDCPQSHNCSEESQICCPRPDFICTQPEDAGQTCGLPQYRYRYDSENGTCTRFIYSGCYGNANNFIEQKDCRKFCQKLSYCHSGSEPLLDDEDGQAIACANVDDQESCPPGYTCQKNQAGLSYCCTAPPKCYSDLDPYVPLGKTSPLSCMPGHFGFNDGCLSGYECQLNTNGEYHCCPDANVTNACSDNAAVHTYWDRQVPTKCYAADPSCPDGYSCRFNPGFGHYFCCSQRGKEVIPRKQYGKAVKENIKQLALDIKCADGSSPYIDPYLKSVRICNPYLHFTCPSSYACVFNPSTSNYYCCISNEILPDNVEMTLRKSLACPAGLQPFINSTIGQPIICQPSLPGICPLTSICQYSPLYWQFICCTSSPQPGDNFIVASVLRPGDVGCINDFQCSKNFPGAYCRKSVCTCPASMLLHQKTCVFTCPAGYVGEDGVCELLVSLDAEN